mgnify:FL=1
MDGKVPSIGSIRIDGTINGDITAGVNNNIGENGDRNGEKSGEVISVGGKVVGTITAREKLTLEAKSILKGDISSKILVVEAGARFDGKSMMGQSNQTKFEPAMAEIRPGNEKK